MGKPRHVPMEKGLLQDFHLFHSYRYTLSKGDSTYELKSEKLRKKYMDHPLESMTSDDIYSMSEKNFLDMDYFLKEENFFDVPQKSELSIKKKVFKYLKLDI